jgi:multidrug efflux system membrane fusion protein
LQVDAYSRDDQNKLASGKLETIDNEIDQTTGTGKLKAVFLNNDNSLWPNQFVNVHMLLETRKNTLVIPAAAVQRGQQGTYVFVMGADKKVQVRQVTVAITQNNISAISSGLQANDTVVTDGQDKLDANSLVEPRSPNPGANHQPQPNAGVAGQ